MDFLRHDLPVSKRPLARPPRLLDLPDAVLSRVCAYLARRPLFAPYPANQQDLPHHLLPLAATCHRLRAHAVSVVQSLDCEPYSSWAAFAAWLRFASPNLRTLCVRPLPSHPDRPLRQDQLLPPPLVFSSLSFHAPPLRRLDLSGLTLTSVHDAVLLGAVLTMLRPTLTHLTLLDSQSALKRVTQSVVDARLTNLVSFTYLSLRSDCHPHLQAMLESFASDQHASSPQTRLTHLHLHMEEPSGNSFPTNNFLASLCASLTDFTFASEFETPQMVPYDFISEFQGIHRLTLKDLALDHNALVPMLTALPKLNDLRLEGCLILHDDEHLVHRISRPFLDLVSLCAPVLTSLWFPARFFSEVELQHLAVIRPPLKSLAVTLSPSSLPALPRLCSALSATLENLRVTILTDEGNTVVLSDLNQRYILRAVTAAPKLASLHFVSFYMRIDIIKQILQRVGAGLTELYVEVNPTECAEVQFEGTIRLLEYVARFCHSLTFFCLENETPQELQRSSAKAARLTEGVDKVLAAAPYLSETSLRSLLSLWISQDVESEATNGGEDPAD